MPSQMADVTYLRHREREADDDSHLAVPDHTLFLESVDFDFDFDFYRSDPEFPPPDSPRGDPGSIPCTDLLDRENQVNFVMDLFQQRVEQSQVMPHTDFPDPNFDVPFAMDFSGSGSGFGGDSLPPHDNNSGFILENYGSGSEPLPTACPIRPFDNSAPLLAFVSDSDDEENGVLGVCVDEYNVHEDHDDVASIPFCWDSLQLDDNGDNAEDFEWEEVDVRVDEREVLSTLTGEDDVSVSPINGLEEEEEEEEEDASVMGENLGWQVLLNANNLDTNPDLDHDSEPYFGDHDDYIYTAEYEMMFGQFADNENPLAGRPPASVSVVRNLPSVIVAKQDIHNNGALCAVCKDEFNVEEKAKQLPCSHFYHGECIIPWLGIRNTCPVCRYELPTDDADYERRRVQRSGRS